MTNNFPPSVIPFLQFFKIVTHSSSFNHG
jgi:hypothetical protein